MIYFIFSSKLSFCAERKKNICVVSSQLCITSSSVSDSGGSGGGAL